MNKDNMAVLYSGRLGIDYGQFYIDVADEDETDDYLDPVAAFEQQENGICGAAQPGKLFFVTGIQGGAISIAVELHESAPPIDDSYEEIVEVSFSRSGAEISLCEWAHEATHELALPGGTYRVRYCIEGMDKDYGDDDDWEAPLSGQRHLVQIWRGEQASDEIVKQTSETAAYWHREWGGTA